jgi:hypothetical protein
MFTPQKPDPVPNEVIMKVHRATGMGILAARSFLNGASPILYGRFLEALTIHNNQDPHQPKTEFYDPVEDDEQWKEAIAQAEAEAEAEAILEIESLGEENIEMGRSYHMAVCKAKKRILKEKFGLEWFSQYELCPDGFWPYDRDYIRNYFL